MTHILTCPPAHHAPLARTRSLALPAQHPHCAHAQEIKAKTTALQQSVMKIGEALAGKQGGEGGSSEGSEGGSTTQDAEVKDKP